MDVDWEKAVQRWQGLNLSALYHAENIHNRSLALISSIISQKLHEVLQTVSTSTTSTTTLQTPTPIIAGDPSHQTQVVGVVTQPWSSVTSASPVSWQTAFWTLTAIALNTCLQDCGRVCGIQKDFSLLVRSSPLICLADGLIILVQTFFFAFVKGPRNAIQIVALSRDQHSSRATSEDVRPVRYIVRGILLTLAVIQSLKLFSLSGIPWTQFFGACYLFSYTANAFLNVFGSPRSPFGAVDIPQRGSAILDRKLIMPAARLAAVTQLIAWTVSLAQALPDDGLLSWGTCAIVLHCIGVLYMMAPILFIFSTTFMTILLVDLATVLGPASIVLYLCHIHPRHGWSNITELTASIMNVADDTAVIGILAVSTLTALILHVCFYPFWVVNIIMTPLLDTHGPKLFWLLDTWDPYGLALVFISVSALLSHLMARIFLFGTLAKKLHLRHLSIASDMGSACLFLFVANVAFGLIYYTVAYDSSNTHKPGWTDNLGRFLL